MIQSRLEELNDSMGHVQTKIDEEMMCKYTNLHIIDRMKKDIIASQIKSAEMEASLKNKNSIMELETMKQRKTKEERLQSKAIFDSLMKNIEKEQKDR